jgi:signal peptidase II
METIDRPPDDTKRQLPPPAYRGKWIVLATISLIMVAGDQMGKHWAHSTLRTNHGGQIVIKDKLFALRYVRNPGAAWGFLADSNPSFRRPFFLAISVIAIAFILYVFLRLGRDQQLVIYGLSGVMGGAIGNFIDRLRFDYVIDFIDMYIGGYKWPTYNIADVAISVGVGLLLLDMVIGFFRRPASRSQERPPPETRPPQDGG